MAKKMLRPQQIYGKGRSIPVGRTAFVENYVFDEAGAAEQFVPGTNVPRLKLARIGPRTVAGFEDEVDALVEGLRAHRDAQLAAKQTAGRPAPSRSQPNEAA